MSDLQALRDATTASYAFRTKAGKTITRAEYDAMPSYTKEQKAAKAKYQWRPDPKLVRRLVKAERSWQPPVRVP